MSKRNRGRGADRDQNKPSDAADPPGKQRSPRFLQLLALPIIILLILALIGLLFYVRYTTPPSTPAGMEEVSGQAAPPAAAPAKLVEGPRVPAFEARTIGGQRLTFPNDYRGKLVMVDFWATWCRPCVSEIPNVVETYQAFHARGFEIVGITLDSSAPHGSPAEVLRFTRGANASWPQIYENAMAISQKFGVDNIPAAFLVDGDTGRLLASGESLRGTRLRATIEKCLEQKKGSLHDGK